MQTTEPKGDTMEMCRCVYPDKCFCPPEAKPDEPKGDTMTDEQRAKVESLKAERKNLATPIERIAFDNDPANGPIALRIIAMVES